jgi:hypothetical protein
MVFMYKVSSIKKLFLEWWTLFNLLYQEKKISIEIHFFDFDADLYDHKITKFQYLNTSVPAKFDSVDLLTEQLKKIKVLQSLIYTNFNIY